MNDYCSNTWLERYYNIGPYAYCNGNPILFIDPNGMDWYRHDETGATFWTDRNANFASEGELRFRNIGETHSEYSNGLRIDYNQNEITNVTEVNPDFNLSGGEYIPKIITTDDGSKVSFTFNYISPTGGNGDKSISSDVVGTLITGINEANNAGAGIVSVDISTSSTGRHSATSSHYVSNGARAIDIDAVNGVSVRNSSSHSRVNAIQNGFKSNSNLRENYGPNIQEKSGKRISIGGHDNHIHMSTMKK